ncbi:MAG TPA: hypothetical protein VFB13_17790 [Reyranella sp.]|jgi:hypothetical protein|nr:hypothetical protein [Reyranella sp.]
MSRRKSFVYDMYPQDFNDGVKGLPDEVVGVYVKLINLMRIEGGPLPPRKLRLARAEFDEWIRDKLGHKNIRTWLRAKRVLLGDPDKLVELPDGRIANPRTERDLAKRRHDDDDSSAGGNGQTVLPFRAPSAAAVHEAVDDVGDERGTDGEQVAASGDDRSNFGRSSGEVRPIRAAKSLKSPGFRCASPYPCIRIPHESVAAVMTVAARARGDPRAVA